MISLRKLVDGLESSKKASIERWSLLGWSFDPEKLIGGNIESFCDANDHLRMRTKFSALVVGNDGLNDVGFFGKLDLGETALLTEASETFAKVGVVLLLGR